MGRIHRLLGIGFMLAAVAAGCASEPELDELGGLYATDGTTVYFVARQDLSNRPLFDFSSSNPDRLALIGADLDTFEVLSETWARDDSTVYFGGRHVTGADPATFTMLEDTSETDWGMDNTGVYHLGSRIDGADPATFELVGNDGWARDAQSVYRTSERQDGFDAQTFTALRGGYYHDANVLFYAPARLVIADANTAALDAAPSLYDDGANLAWDDERLWFNGHRVTVRRSDGSIDVPDVSTLSQWHSMQVFGDADGVYARLIDRPDDPGLFYQVDMVDPATFESGAIEDDEAFSFTVRAADLSRAGRVDAPSQLMHFSIVQINPGFDVERLDCGYNRRDDRVFYFGVLVPDQPAAGFSPRLADDTCRTEQWLLDAFADAPGADS